MVLDLEALFTLAKHKIPMYVYNSNTIDSINDVIDGTKGTRVITK